jgi:hypothetical protein
MPGPASAAWIAKDAGVRPTSRPPGKASDHGVDRRVLERLDAGVEAGAFTGSDDAVVVGGCEAARE